MTLALLLAGLAVAASVVAVVEARATRRSLAEASDLLLRAERAWGERHRIAVAWRDDEGEAVAASALCDLIRARAALEELHHGR